VSLIPGNGKRYFSSPVFRPALCLTQPPIQRATEALLPGVKLPGHQAHHIYPCNANVNNTWSYTSTPPCAFMASCLKREHSSFTFSGKLFSLSSSVTHRMSPPSAPYLRGTGDVACSFRYESKYYTNTLFNDRCDSNST
jgi:hypothetical protein